MMTPERLNEIEAANAVGKIWSQDVVAELLAHIREGASDAVSQIGENIELMELAEPLIRLNKARAALGAGPVRLKVRSSWSAYSGMTAFVSLVLAEDPDFVLNTMEIDMRIEGDPK